MVDLTRTIAPKSDQLNSDNLIGGPMTIRVTRVSLCAEPDQPIAISFEGDGGKPYRPCKTMRRLLVAAWGPDGAQYAGRSMTLYRDETVRFGGAAVGGIRISHLSHIEKPLTIALTAAKAVRKPYRVKPLRDETPTLASVVARIEGAATEDALQGVVEMAGKLTDEGDRQKARTAFAARLKAIRAEEREGDFIMATNKKPAEAIGGLVLKAASGVSCDPFASPRKAGDI